MMKDVKMGKRAANCLLRLGGLVAIGVLIVLLVLVGRPMIARQLARASALIAPPSSDTPNDAPLTPAAIAVAPRPMPPGAWITLSPASGSPGTIVEVAGFVPGGPVASTAKATIVDQYYREPEFGTVYWESCPDGLKETVVNVHWSATRPGHFMMQLPVPDAAWQDARGIHLLTAGAYTVGIQCLAPDDGTTCDQHPAQATATFHLTGADRAAASCGPADRPDARFGSTGDGGAGPRLGAAGAAGGGPPRRPRAGAWAKW